MIRSDTSDKASAPKPTPVYELARLDDVPNRVDFEDGIDVLEHCGGSLETQPGVDALRRKVSDNVIGPVLDVLHEHQIPDLDESILTTTDRAAIFAVLRSPIHEDLGGGAARPRDSHLPEVVLVASLQAIW